MLKFRLSKSVVFLVIGLWLVPQTGWADYVTKSLYFHVDSGDSDSDEDMSRTVPSGASASTVAIGDGGSNDWIEYPAHPGNLSLKGQNVIRITISNVVGSPDITAELGYYAGGRSGTYTAIKSKKINNSSAGAIDFNLSLGPTTVLAGDPIVVRISEQSGGGDSFDVEFDSSSRQSRVDLNSEIHIDVTLLNTYIGAFTNSTIQTIYNTGDTAYVRSYVEDPFGYSDINSTTLVVIDPGTSTVVNSTLTAISSSGVRNIYEYSYSTGSPMGQYDYTVTSDEGTEGTVSASLSKAFYVYNKTKVKLSNLQGMGYDEQAVILWETSMEVNNLGFNVYRSFNKTKEYDKVNPVFIPGLGDSNQGGKYLFIDDTVENGNTYYYKVEDVDNNSKATLHGPVTITPQNNTGKFEYNPQDYAQIASSNDSQIGNNPGEELANEGEIRILSNDDGSMTIEITPPDYQINEISGPNGSEITMTGYGLTEKEGYPRLPTRGFLIELPQKGDVSLSIVHINTDRQRVDKLYPYRMQITSREKAASFWENSLMDNQENKNLLTSGEKKLFTVNKKVREKRKNRRKKKRRRRIKRKSSLYPEDILFIEHTFNINGTPTVLLRFYPVQVSCNGKEWTIQAVKSIRAQIDITGQETPEDELNQTILTQLDLAAKGALKIKVEKNGIKRISYEELEQAGFDLNEKPRGTTLFRDGKKIPIYIQGEKDGRWDPGDFIEFYGERNSSEYSDIQIYWLDYPEEPGPRIKEFHAYSKGQENYSDFLDTIHLEENHYYFAALPEGDGKDHWFWDFILDGAKKNFPFTLEHVSTNSQRGLITANIQAINEDENIDPDHHTRIYLNDTLIGDVYWDGPYDYQFSGEVDHSLFSEGENIISIEAVGDTVEYDLIYLDSFYVAYYRKYIAVEDRLFFNTSKKQKLSLWGFKEDDIILYDITDPSYPQRLIKPCIESWGDEYSLTFKSPCGLRHYVAFGQEQIEHPPIEKDTPSQLNNSSAGADYIVISHPDFLATIQRLADYRTDKGMRVVVADVQEIYDEFSYGNFNPEAIRLFLNYAWNNWPNPAPSNVLLVGSGTFDFKDYLGFGLINFIPPYLIETDSMQTGSDNRYVSVGKEDNLPKMGIGRLPVWDNATLERIIDRIIQYETEPAPDGMENRICFVADNPDEGGNFEEGIKLLLNQIPPGVSSSEIYLSQLGTKNTRQEILNQFEIGNLIMHYNGHGTINLWASENIFDTDDALSLKNVLKFPFVETMTCLNGYFFNPYTESLAEELLRSETGGAIAVWSPTGLSSDNAMKYLADTFLEEIYNKNNRQLGSAITRAKLNLLQYGPFYDEIDTFILFGDPALQLK